MDNIPEVAESVLRCLKGQSLPNLASPLQMTNMPGFYNSTKIPSSWADVAEKNFEFWAEHWPVLKDEKLIKKLQEFIIPETCQFSNGVNNRLEITEDSFYKSPKSGCFSNEALFYSKVDTEYAILKPFVPELIGVASKSETGSINCQNTRC